MDASRVHDPNQMMPAHAVNISFARETTESSMKLLSSAPFEATAPRLERVFYQEDNKAAQDRAIAHLSEVAHDKLWPWIPTHSCYCSTEDSLGRTEKNSTFQEPTMVSHAAGESLLDSGRDSFLKSQSQRINEFLAYTIEVLLELFKVETRTSLQRNTDHAVDNQGPSVEALSNLREEFEKTSAELQDLRHFHSEQSARFMRMEKEFSEESAQFQATNDSLLEAQSKQTEDYAKEKEGIMNGFHGRIRTLKNEKQALQKQKQQSKKEKENLQAHFQDQIGHLKNLIADLKNQNRYLCSLYEEEKGVLKERKQLLPSFSKPESLDKERETTIEYLKEYIECLKKNLENGGLGQQRSDDAKNEAHFTVQKEQIAPQQEHRESSSSGNEGLQLRSADGRFPAMNSGQYDLGKSLQGQATQSYQQPFRPQGQQTINPYHKRVREEQRIPAIDGTFPTTSAQRIVHATDSNDARNNASRNETHATKRLCITAPPSDGALEIVYWQPDHPGTPRNSTPHYSIAQ